MIKKIIACLTICFIITGIISPVFSDASALPQPNWNDPGISEIINISDLTGWMLNGGTYDVSTYTDAESFMNDYYAARTKTRLEGSDYQVKSSFGLEQTYYELGDSAYSNPLDVNRVISSSFRDHSGYGRRLSNEVNDALLSSGSLYDTKIPLLNEVEFANFVGYNHNALRLYSEFFDTDTPNPSPDSIYNFLSNTNSAYTNDVLITSANYYSPSSLERPIENYTLFGEFMYNNSNHHNSSSSNLRYVRFFYPSLTINLDFDNSTNKYIANYGSFDSVDYVTGNSVANTQTYTLTKFGSNQWYRQMYTQTAYQLQSEFDGLSIAINYIYNNFSNINLYVDGSLWVSNNPDLGPTVTPEFPDAVGGEDLESTTWPISRPRAPYYTSVPGVLQAIEDAIAGDGELDIDDLKPYLTDSNGDPVPDPIFDPEPVPIPVPDPVNPDIVPGLPVLPAIPLDMPGFNGVSVLAEIINFTNQSLPTALIVTFWGIVFGIVILGLIKILHK